MSKIKKFLKENIIYILVLVVFAVIVNYKLPYYVSAPGGTINIIDRIVSKENNDVNGNINLLYVTEFEGTPATLLLAKIFKKWDIYPVEDIQINNESNSEIRQRDKIMLDNSLTNASFVAYKTADKEIKINSIKNLVIATTKEHDGSLEIDDQIIEINNQKVATFEEIKKIINNSNVGDKLLFKIIRDNKEKQVNVEVKESDGNKIIGVVIITNYDYELDPKIEFKFKNNESGSSGGMMIALAIYVSITDEDILKGRNIAGTGTIDIEGNVGEISGIKYKIQGAARKKMDIVFVSSMNYEEAIKTKEKYNYDIEIVSVDKFDEVIDYLRKEE